MNNTRIYSFIALIAVIVISPWTGRLFVQVSIIVFILTLLLSFIIFLAGEGNKNFLYPPSRKTLGVSPRMSSLRSYCSCYGGVGNAKHFPLRRDFALALLRSGPGEARGEETTSVLRQAQDGELGRTISSRELHIALIINAISLFLTLPQNIDPNIINVSRVEQDILTRRFDYYGKDLGRLYTNRLGLLYHYDFEPIIHKYETNLFVDADLNAYFFGSHPREQSLGNEFIKFSVLFSPLFIVGFIASLTKKKGIAMLFGINLVLSALYSTGYKPGPLLLYPYFVFFIAYGFRICLEKSYLLIKRY